MRTHYDLLNVSEGAIDEVVRAAYRVLARRYHPDRNGNSAHSVERMQALNEAYAVLTDPVRRRQYDEMLRQGRTQVANQARMQANFQARSAATQPHYGQRSSRHVRRPREQTLGQTLASMLMWDLRLTIVVVFLLLGLARQIFSRPERPYPSIPPSAYSSYR